MAHNYAPTIIKPEEIEEAAKLFNLDVIEKMLTQASS